jgi:hypothetical protein
MVFTVKRHGRLAQGAMLSFLLSGGAAGITESEARQIAGVCAVRSCVRACTSAGSPAACSHTPGWLRVSWVRAGRILQTSARTHTCTQTNTHTHTCVHVRVHMCALFVCMSLQARTCGCSLQLLGCARARVQVWRGRGVLQVVG